MHIPGEFLDLGGDSAQYIILAESLVQGKGFRILNYPQEPNFVVLHQWIKPNLPPGGIIISRKPTITYFYTGHKALVYPYTTEPDEIWQEIGKHNAQYLLVDEFSRETYYYLSPFLYKYKNKLALL